MEVQSVATFEFQAASIGVAAHWVVDRASRPGKWCLVRGEEATQDLKSDNRTIAQRRGWVVLVTEFATLFVEGRVQPHDPPAERATTWLYFHDGGPAFGVPETQRIGGFG